MRYFVLFGVIVFGLISPTLGATRYAVLGPSTMMDMVLNDVVNGCEGSARVFARNPKSLPANLRAQIMPPDYWGSLPIDSLRAVVACKGIDSMGSSYKYSVSINMSKDTPYGIDFSVQNYIFLGADYDSGWGGDFTRSSLDVTALYDYDAAAIDLRGGYDPGYVGIIYGIAVSPDLYHALQVAQGIDVPAGADDRLPQYQPNIWKSQYTSIVSDVFNSAKTDASAFLGLSTSNVKLRVCRFWDGSGVQKASNGYFLNEGIGSDGPFGGAIAPAAEASWGPSSGLASFEVREASSAIDVRSCLSQNGYSIGVLTVENAVERDLYYSPNEPADRRFRFVKLNGVPPFEFKIPDRSGNLYIKTQRVMTHDAVESGAYDFWSPVYYWNANTINIFFGIGDNTYKRLQGMALGLSPDRWYPIPGVHVSGDSYAAYIWGSRQSPNHFTTYIGNVVPPRVVTRGGALYPVVFDF